MLGVSVEACELPLSLRVLVASALTLSLRLPGQVTNMLNTPKNIYIHTYITPFLRLQNTTCLDIPLVFFIFMHVMLGEIHTSCPVQFLIGLGCLKNKSKGIISIIGS